MKAIVVEGPNAFTYADRDIGQPAPHEAVVRIAAAGVCGTDLEILDGTMAYFTSGLTAPSFSSTAGPQGPNLVRARPAASSRQCAP